MTDIDALIAEVRETYDAACYQLCCDMPNRLIDALTALKPRRNPMTKAETMELRDCPFCGAKARLNLNPKTGYVGPDCDHLGHCPIDLDFRDYADPAQAIREWNTRVPSPDTTRIAELEGQLEASEAKVAALQAAADGMAKALEPFASETTLGLVRNGEMVAVKRPNPAHNALTTYQQVRGE